MPSDGRYRDGCGCGRGGLFGDGAARGYAGFPGQCPKRGHSLAPAAGARRSAISRQIEGAGRNPRPDVNHSAGCAWACGIAFGIDHFGASAPAAALAKEFGFTPDHIAQLALDTFALAAR